MSDFEEIEVNRSPFAYGGVLGRLEYFKFCVTYLIVFFLAYKFVKTLVVLMPFIAIETLLFAIAIFVIFWWVFFCATKKRILDIIGLTDQSYDNITKAGVMSGVFCILSIIPSLNFISLILLIFLVFKQGKLSTRPESFE